MKAFPNEEYLTVTLSLSFFPELHYIILQTLQFIFSHLKVTVPIIKPRSGKSQMYCNAIINAVFICFNVGERWWENPTLYTWLRFT